MTDRSERRAQKKRNRDRWARIVRGWSAYSGDQDPWFERTVRMQANHGVLCSCFMCGNRRKYDGETIQERRALNIKDFEG